MPVSKKRKLKKNRKTAGGRFREPCYTFCDEADAAEWEALHYQELLSRFLVASSADGLEGEFLAQELAVDLIRSKPYYSLSREHPFVKAYLVSGIPNQEMLSNDLRYMRTDAVFASLYDSIARAFPYRNFLEFDLLFFGPKEKVLRELVVDFDSAPQRVCSSEITARACHIIEEIDRIGGLGNARRHNSRYTGPTLLGTIRQLNCTDKVYLYHYDYMKYHRLDKVAAFNAGFAHFQHGDYDRALFYYFMSDLSPLVDADPGPGGGNCLDYLIRALIQKEYAKGSNSPRTFREDILARDGGFGRVEDDTIDAYMIYGCPTHSRHEKIERSLLRLNRLRQRNQILPAIDAFDSIKNDLAVALQDYENEKFQADLIERLYTEVKRFIDFAIAEGHEGVAFDAFEYYKSIILKLSLGEGRAGLLKRLSTDEYYLRLKEKRPVTTVGATGERQAGSVTWHTAPRGTEASGGLVPKISQIEGNDSGALDSATVLLEYYCGESQHGVFVCRASTPPLFVPLSALEGCRDAVERLSEALSTGRSAAGKAGMLQTLLASVYDALIRPVAEIVKGYRHLVVVPTNFLFNCPFSALHDGSFFLIEKFMVSVIPSYSLYRNPMNKSDRIRSINFVRGDDKLSGIGEELRRLSDYFPSDGVRVLTQLSEVRKKGSDADILHVAAHGTFDRSEPLLSRIHVGADALTVLDLYEMDLSKVRLAVVNACVTGKAEVAAADDLFGLVRGFLVAGCPSVINTLWNLSDEVAPLFTTFFYREVLSGKSLLHAFTDALKEIAQSERFRNPYYWACYQYYGRP